MGLAASCPVVHAKLNHETVSTHITWGCNLVDQSGGACRSIGSITSVQAVVADTTVAQHVLGGRLFMLKLFVEVHIKAA